MAQFVEHLLWSNRSRALEEIYGWVTPKTSKEEVVASSLDIQHHGDSLFTG